jgi:N-acetylglucosaminyldiphosphoundecaprenol N-acetyl-beta-D-mannosaminyltransferase
MKVNILGHSISAFNYQLAYQTLSTIFEGKHYITVNNVHTVVEGIRNPAYKQIINNAAMALPDGMPLVKVARWKGATEIERVFGPTFFEKTLDWGQKDGLKHFFFGSSEETLQKMKKVIEERFPDAIISGMIAPPFRPFTARENEEFMQQINEANPDIIWVSLGAPKQEFWIYENYKKLHRGVMIGIGAGFDYLAGNTKHAPQWMKNMALEWLYRLIQEPGRLWKRYLVTNTLFVWYLFLELLGLKKFE